MSIPDSPLTLKATFYSREETQGHLPASGIPGATLQEALGGEGLLQCAIDPDVIPMLSEFTITLWNGNEVRAKALDVGTAIKGNIIDIFVDTNAEAIELGVKEVTAFYFVEGSGEQLLSSLNQTTAQTKALLTLTFYGYPDNDPVGDAIAYPQIHTVAGGTGTYDDPRTVAIVTDKNGGHWSPGTRMYVPQLSQYLIVEDECASCVPDQIDVWMDSTEANADKVLQCEKTWTPKEAVEVEIDPPPGRPVIPTPFFDTSTGQCRQPSLA